MPEHVVKASAATQARPPEVVHEPAPPPPPAPPARHEPSALPPLPWWQRKTIVIPIAAILIIAAVSLILVALSGNEPSPRTQSAPLNGTFDVEFAAQTAPNGEPLNTPGGRETWVIQSACPTGGCVATATRVSGSQAMSSTMVLDEIGGRWTAVSAISGTCENAPAEFWESMSLQLRPDGSLDGDFVVRATTGCDRNQQVKFTRTGDVQPNASVADPKTQPPRVASPAQGLRGRYQETDRYAADGRSADAGFDIQTYCLRTGDRCLSFWMNPDDDKTLTFAQSKWTLTNTSGQAKCTSGSPAQRQITLEYPLPQPPQNPITLLTGRGHYTVTGDCSFNSDFDSRVQRTGD
jgi:serine/threonine-protein kinase